MGFLSFLNFGRTPDTNGVTASPANMAAWIASGPIAHSDCNTETALTVAAVFACVRVIAGTISSLPVVVYENLPDGGRRKARIHPLNPLLNLNTNEYTRASVFWDWLVTEFLTGNSNAFAYIERNNAGDAINLMPLQHGGITVKMVNGEKVYQYKSATTIIADADMIHVHSGLTFDCLVGGSILNYARNAVNLTLSQERFGQNFFTRGANVKGFLTTSKVLSKEARDAVKDLWAKFQGEEGAHGCPLLPEAIDFKQTSVDPDKAQMTESKKFSLAEVARYYRVPLSKLNEASELKYATAEQFEQAFLNDCIRPHLVRIEQELAAKLLSPADQLRYSIAFDLDAILRADTAARYAGYASALQSGWKTVNEVREDEDLPPMAGGDVLRTPLNMGPAAPSPATDANDAKADTVADAPDDKGDASGQ